MQIRSSVGSSRASADQASRRGSRGSAGWSGTYSDLAEDGGEEDEATTRIWEGGLESLAELEEGVVSQELVDETTPCCSRDAYLGLGEQ